MSSGFGGVLLIFRIIAQAERREYYYFSLLVLFLLLFFSVGSSTLAAGLAVTRSSHHSSSKPTNFTHFIHQSRQDAVPQISRTARPLQRPREPCLCPGRFRLWLYNPLLGLLQRQLFLAGQGEGVVSSQDL